MSEAMAALYGGLGGSVIGGIFAARKSSSLEKWSWARAGRARAATTSATKDPISMNFFNSLSPSLVELR
jgi:hypothetical protein